MSFCFQIGSTEWVEQNIVNLFPTAVAYLNVDCAVQGPGIFPSATPQLDDLILDVIKEVKTVRKSSILLLLVLDYVFLEYHLVMHLVFHYIFFYTVFLLVSGE